MDKIKPEWLRIHRTIHSGAQQVVVNNIAHPITIAANGCRQVKYLDSEYGTLIFMEQNKLKDSEYAARAKKGETLTWIMPPAGRWILLEEKVEQKEVPV